MKKVYIGVIEIELELFIRKRICEYYHIDVISWQGVVEGYSYHLVIALVIYEP